MISIQENFDTTPLSSFKIGSEARYFVELKNKKDLPELFKRIKKSRLPYFILGGASNLLFCTKKYNGWVIKFAPRGIKREANIFQVGAGDLLSRLIQEMARENYGGLHKLIGIPGTVGGAIRGNAGSYGTEISDLLLEVEFFDVDKMVFGVFKKTECHFEYRSSIFTNQKNLIITTAKFSSEKENREELEKEMNKILGQRKSQPYSKYSSAGSIFKYVNPEEIKDKEQRRILVHEYQKKAGLKNIHSIPAGYLLGKIGLKGKRIGQAMISREHGNIIINLGEATAKDVLALINLAETEVKDKWGICLKKEIVCIGL
jgi:UDP-N-acetylmuramate dehydrogenase